MYYMNNVKEKKYDYSKSHLANAKKALSKIPRSVLLKVLSVVGIGGYKNDERRSISPKQLTSILFCMAL